MGSPGFKVTGFYRDWSDLTPILVGCSSAVGFIYYVTFSAGWLSLLRKWASVARAQAYSELVADRPL